MLPLALSGIAAMVVVCIVLHGSGVFPFNRQLAIGVDLVTLPFVLAVTVPFSASGLRSLSAEAGVRLSKQPLLWWTGDSALLYKLDVAYIAAVGIVLLAWVTWTFVVKYVLSPEPIVLSLGNWFAPPIDQKGRKWWVVRVFGSLLLFADAGIFFCGFLYGSGFGAKASPLISAVLITAMYVSAIVLLAWFHNVIWGD